MRSHLTRGVFRAILANEPCSHSQCQRQLLLSLPHRRVGRLCPTAIQRRTLFGLPFQIKTDAQSRPNGRENSTDPGMMHMAHLSKALKQRSRPPSPAVLAKAFQDFISARLEYSGVLTDFHARFLLSTFKHLKRQKETPGGDFELLDPVFLQENLESVLLVLAEAECDPLSHPSVQSLARLVFQELRDSEDADITAETLRAYITVLSDTGAPTEAHALVNEFWEPSLQETGSSCWLTVMKGYARQSCSLPEFKQGVIDVVRSMSNLEIPFDQAAHEEVTLCMVNESRMQEARTIYDTEIADNHAPTSATKLAMMKLAVYNSDLAWAEQLFQTLPRDHSPETTDATLLWSAVQGQGAHQIARVLEAMASREPKLRETLTISTINNLIEYSNHTNDPSNAEAYASLAQEWDLQPNAQTNLLLLQSRITSLNAGGIVDSLRKLADEDALDDINLPLMNELVMTLSARRNVEIEHDLILSLVDRLVDRSVRLDPRTLEALCHMLLYANHLDAASELLRPQLDSYNMEMRKTVENAFFRYILDMEQDADIVWEAYELLRVAFPETNVERRTVIMDGFFKRQRSDLACLVFGHMRQSETLGRRPNSDTYAKCFQGIARCADTDGLNLVHNMLKLDLEVEVDTKILNGLMLAFDACGSSEQSMGFFRDILHSEQGPSHSSIIIFLRVCENHHNGREEAMKMMEKLEALEIPIGKHVYIAYIGALAGQCEFERAAEAVRTMESRTSYPPSDFAVATFYNAIPYQYWKDQVEDWAKAAFPELWNQVEKLGYTEEEDGTRNFNIDRNLHI